ncbi:hypothetical protein [Flavobacterium sp. SM2513]|uniref:hypothetical protein n=1 Tax=Flavobacterium sp. SM2513 TaxID=3424766 RepID=UPI003D7F52C4
MDYIPYKDSERAMWNANLNKNIEAIGASLGLDAADILEVKRVTAANAAAIKASSDALLASKAATAAKASQLKSGNAILRTIVRKMKSSSTYTTAIGTSLDIIGDDTSVIDYNNYMPKIKVRVMPGKVRITFVKNKLDGVTIYGRFKGQIAWQKLAFDNYSPFEDKRPIAIPNIPEHREYMAIGVKHDAEVTLQSAIVEAVFGG